MSSGFPTRSWLLRGLYSPAPWGKAVVPWLTNIELVFSRRKLVANEYGGFTGKADEVVWTVRGDVQDNSSGRKSTEPEGPEVKTTWILFVDNPPGAEYSPSKGDTVVFTDTWQTLHRCYVQDVSNPAEEFDHLEITVEEQT